jgi:hypothetical protein
MMSAAAFAFAVFAFGTSMACGGGGEGASDAGSDAPVDAQSDGVSDGPKPGDPCTTAADCDDHVFCDGVEECVGDRCSGPRNVACRDRGGCASSTCVEDAGECVVDLPSPSPCASGESCLPDLGCTKVDGCTSDAACDDGRACTDDRCETSSGRCLHTPDDGKCPAVGACGLGVCLGVDAADPSGCGVLPDASKCKATEGCAPTGACAALPASCVRDDDCGDGNLCDGREKCIGSVCNHGDVTTCAAPDACHHVTCRDRSLGDPFCLADPLPACP